MGSKEEFLEERVRAEDILLGSLGYAEEARIKTLEVFSGGFRGVGTYSNGEEFHFESDIEPDELEQWALGVLGNLCQKKPSKKPSK